jgi:hypothetical protein
LPFAGNAEAQPKPLVIPTKWYAIQLEAAAATVEMPGVPDHRVVNDKSARGTVFPLHSYSLEIGGYSYVAQTALYPADVDATRPRAIVQSALDGRAQQLANGKWTKIEWREIGGATAADSLGTLKGGLALRQLVLVKERRFVSLGFLGAPGGMAGIEAERFFKSLKLV